MSVKKVIHYDCTDNTRWENELLACEHQKRIDLSNGIKKIIGNDNDEEFLTIFDNFDEIGKLYIKSNGITPNLIIRDIEEILDNTLTSCEDREYCKISIEGKYEAAKKIHDAMKANK